MKTLTKRMVVIMLSLCLACGMVCAAGQATGMTAEAKTKTIKVTSKSTVNKKVKAIVNKQVKKKDSKSTKLKKLFTYVEKKYKYRSLRSSKYLIKWTKSARYKGWERDFAYEMLTNNKKGGSCYHYAAAYAYLAKAATNYPVRVGVGKTVGFDKKQKRKQDHAWVEIKISNKWYVFDPNMDKQMKKSKLVYYKKSRNSSSMKKIYNKYKGVKYTNITL